MQYTQYIAKLALSTAVAYTCHYGVTKLYNEVCIPDGFWGYLQGFVTTGSPVCQVMYNVMTRSQVTYNSLVFASIGNIIIDKVHGLAIKSPEVAA